PKNAYTTTANDLFLITARTQTIAFKHLLQFFIHESITLAIIINSSPIYDFGAFASRAIKASLAACRGGNWPKEFKPNAFKNCGVVINNAGLPGSSRNPDSLIQFQSNSVRKI